MLFKISKNFYHFMIFFLFFFNISKQLSSLKKTRTITIVFKDILNVLQFSLSHRRMAMMPKIKKRRDEETRLRYICVKNIIYLKFWSSYGKKKKESTIKRPFERISSLSLYYSPRILIKIELKFRGLEFFEFLIKI